MLSRIVVSVYSVLNEIVLWLLLLLFVIGGWFFPINLFGKTAGFVGSIIGFVVWFVIAVIFFGTLFVLHDIRRSVKKIEDTK